MIKKYQVFIYGYCQRSQKDNYILKNCKYNGFDIIKGWNMMSLDEFPLAVKNKNIYNTNSFIIVERYEVPESMISTLDKYYNVPKYYNRIMVTSKSGKRGILYIAEDGKSKLKGNGIPIPNGNWLFYKKIEEKIDKRKKRKLLESQIESENNKKKQKEKLKQKVEEPKDEKQQTGTW